MKKYFHFETAPYMTEVLFLNDTTKEEAVKILNKYHQGKQFIKDVEELFDSRCKGFCIQGDGNEQLLYVRKLKDKSDWHATIAHEIQHLVNNIYIITDMKYDSDNIEPHCHLTGYITSKIYEQLNKK